MRKSRLPSGLLGLVFALCPAGVSLAGAQGAPPGPAGHPKAQAQALPQLRGPNAPAAKAAAAQGAPATKGLPVAKKGKDGQPVADPAEGLLEKLRGPEGEAVEAAQKLGALGTPRAVEIMLDELSTGLSPKVAAELLVALAPRKDPQTLDVLAFYARDRNPDLRKKAVAALQDIPDQRVVPILIAALSDPTADVRAAAAQALGTRKEKSAEPQLLKLLAHKDSAAPLALGQIGGPETARVLGELVGNVPDRLVVQTLGELLKRKDFGPDPLRLEVVKTLSKIPGADALDVLSDYVKATAKDKVRPSRAEASKIIEQRTAK